jgi:hypothetical protein
MTNFSFLPGRRLLALALPLAGLLASPARAQQITFGAPATYSNSSTYLANGFAVADVNNDGVLDLLSVSSTNRSAVVVQLGTGNGTFGAATLYGTGTNSSPVDVTVADVNGDGLPDLVTANNGSNAAGVLLGKSAVSGGGFEPAQQYATEPQTQYASRPNTVAVADVNGDGLPDLVAANSGTNTLGVLLGKSAASGGGFQPVQIYPTSSAGLPSDVKVADVNGDGLPDLITALSNSGGIGVLLGRSAASGGGFQPMQYYSLGRFDAYPYSVTVVDVDADGLLDLVAPLTNYNAVGVLLGKSAASGGGFQPAQTYTTINRQIGDVTVGDLNSDGLLDLVISDGALLGKSAANGGGFQPIQFFTSNSGGGGRGRVRVADLNGDGRPDLITSGVTVRLNTTGLPTLNSLSVLGGPAGTSLTLTGTYLGTATAVSLNGQAIPFTVVNATTITATVPAGGTTGNVVVTTPTGVSNGLLFTITLPDLVISTTATIPAGAYNNITVTGTGVATLGGDVTVVVKAAVQDGGTFYDNCYVLSGSGSFSLGTDATLGICNPAGITSGATGAGAIQVTGGRGFSYNANYVYLGTTAQSTGTGLLFQVRSLTTTNPAGLTLSAPTSVTQALTIGGAGDLLLNGQALTLLSNANGTALVVNSGTGVVRGAATVQRYIDPSRNPATTFNPLRLGYRHYAAPVGNTTVADLAASNFSGIFQPVVNASYNTSANPTFVTPFPTVFGYDQALVSRTTALPTFDKGFFSPAALTDALVPGRGYAVNIGSLQIVDFVGTLTTGDLTVPLSRNAAGTPGAADAGWALLGNPYPAPLDYARVAPADRQGLEAAIYVYSSTSQYQGQYRSYVNGIGNSVLPLGQGFFARVASGQTSGALTFRNSQRLTAPNNTPFQRTTADPRPQVQLALSGAGLSDEFVAYAESGATPAFDAAFDAIKLPNSTGLNLSSIATSGESLAIDGRAAFAAATVLPLAVGVPAAGTYALAAADLANLPAGLDAYLADDLVGQMVKLSLGTSYSFSVSAAQAASLITGRFRLLFRPVTALATTATALSAESVSVYPNPARERFTVVVPGLGQASTVQAELLNSLGQVVRRQAAALPATGTQLTLDAAGLAAGVYTLRLQAGATTLAKRLAVQ